MPIVGIVIMLAVVGVLAKLGIAGLAEAQRWQRRFFRDWVAAARTAGLDAQMSRPDEARAAGVVEGVAMRAKLALVQAGKQQALQCSIWSSSPHVPRNLSLRHDSVLQSMSRWVDGSDVPIGDARFDELVELPVVDARVCAALCFEARKRLTRLLDWGVYVHDGKVVSTTNWTVEHNRSMAALMHNLSGLTRLLAVPPGELPQRLAHNALEDPMPEVRFRNLGYLVAAETQAPGELILQTAASLLDDEHLPVRMLAAEHAGVHGHAVLRAVAADTNLELADRMQAVQGLARPPLPDLAGLHAMLVQSQEPMLAYAALSSIDAGASAALFQAVLGCAESPHEAVRAAAARALGVGAYPESEPVLIRLLSDASTDVQQASAEALGLFASAAAVEPLLPLAASLVRPRLRQAARGAIGRIQSRLGDVEAGRLSLSDPHDLAGAVDVVDASAGVRVGELSLSDEDVPSSAAAGALRVER